MDNMNIQTISEPADFLKNLYVTAFIMKDNQAEKRPNMYLSEMLPAVVGIEYEDLDDYIRFFDKTIYQYQQRVLL